MKAQAKPLVVRTRKRIHALQIDVVADNNEPPLRELALDAARRVRQDDCFHSHPRKDANRKYHILRRVSLIEMDAPLHPRNWYRSYFPNDHLSGVPNGCRLRKIRDLRI